MFTTDIYQALAPYLEKYDADQVVAVVAKSVKTQWEKLPFRSIPTYFLTGGEESKSLEILQQIWDFLLDHKITRRGLIVCVGGGTVTDTGGFAAATYKRGIDYINIPTTLLAMVDASAGGKTGINYRGLKNIIGSFHSPVETIVCPSWLHTLPTEQLLSGFSEMLKHALLSDEIEWNRILTYDIEAFDIPSLSPFLETSLAIKKRIVLADPKEQGLRKALNFGHTFGHALEEIALEQQTATPRPVSHGYAVLYGMIAELYLSVVLLACPQEPLQQLTQIMLHYYGRPQCRCKDKSRLIALMQQDKKNEHVGEINCTLLKNIGQPVVNQAITPEQAMEAFEYLFSL